MSKYKPLVETVDEYGVLKAIKARTRPLDDHKDLDVFLDHIGDAKIVMLGEDTHGTHEFYTWRNMITRRLILEKGFTVIASQGDWPEGCRINKFIKNLTDPDVKASDVLKSLQSWPAWLWANKELSTFMDWLQTYNATLPSDKSISFFGLDGYSLWRSLESILEFLKRTNPDSLPTALSAYQCFEPYRNLETNSYGQPLPIVPELQASEVTGLLADLHKKTVKDVCDPGDKVCQAIRSALLGKVESYYHSLIKGGAQAWNLRDQHMADMLDHLMALHGPQTKVVVWAHNTHIGDARASILLDRGMYNMGELMRHRHGSKAVFLAGFGTYRGTVTAASQWGARMEKMELPPARPGSWDYLLHRAGPSNKLLFMSEFREPWFTEDRLDLRAIGVVYNPRLDAYHNYVSSELAARYDAFLHVDITSALHVLN